MERWIEGSKIKLPKLLFWRSWLVIDKGRGDVRKFGEIARAIEIKYGDITGRFPRAGPLANQVCRIVATNDHGSLSRAQSLKFALDTWEHGSSTFSSLSIALVCFRMYRQAQEAVVTGIRSPRSKE